MLKKTGIGIVGVGAISGIYLKNLTELFREVEVAGVCDLIPERAQKAADEYGVRVYKDMHELFADPKVEIVLNLTRPYEHFEVTKAALLAGKHVYSEKPIAVDMDEATELVELAKKMGLLLGGAPDTFMGAGIQTARKIIDAGLIGDIVGADCAMICHGHETWHPDPEFYYKRGGGPMLDMGPYYVTALCNLLGEAKTVVGITKKSFDTRLITSKPHFGEVIDVDVDTHLAGCIEFSSGAIVQIITTFDVHYSGQAKFEIYGTEGTLVVPDPNTFGGNVLLLRPEDFEKVTVDPGLMKPEEITMYRGYRHMPLMFGYRENSRSLGLADMCKAIRTGREIRANCDLQIHVLEILTSFSKSCKERKYIDLATKYTRSAPMKNLAMPGVLD